MGVDVVIIGARTLVGIGHRAALGQAPRAGDGDGAIDAARAGGSRHHHAAFAHVEIVRHLHQHAVRLLRAGQAGESRILASRCRGHAAVKLGVAAIRGEIGDTAPVVPDGTLAQFGRRGLRGIGEAGRDHAAQTIKPQAGGQQVIAIAVFGGALWFDQDGFLRRGTLCLVAAGGQGHAGQEQGWQSHCHVSPKVSVSTRKLTHVARAIIVLWYHAARATMLLGFPAPLEIPP